MNSWFRRALGAGMLFGVAMVSISACADNEASIFIRQVVVPSSSDCSYAADPGGTFFSHGVMDLAFSREYWAGLLIGNQLVKRGSSEVLRVETSRFRAEGAEVQIETTDGAVVQSFTVPVAGFADPSSGTDPGWGVVTAVLIDAGTGNALAANPAFEPGVRSDLVSRVIAVVKVFGRTLGGQEIESGEFRFPISICYGCLVSFPPEATDPSATLPQPNCLASTATGGSVEIPCNLGQDFPVDCRLCRSMGGGSLCDP